jgi:hypothetical protein
MLEHSVNNTEVRFLSHLVSGSLNMFRMILHDLFTVVNVVIAESTQFKVAGTRPTMSTVIFQLFVPTTIQPNIHEPNFAHLY